jgi:hypothetical protein
VICEITCIDIKCSSSDSMKMLVFKFSTNVNKDKNQMGAMRGDDMMMNIQGQDNYAH